MNKILSLALGGVLAAGTIGAVAVALPGAAPTVTIQEVEYPDNMYPNDVNNLTAKWDAEKKVMVVTFEIPSEAPCYSGDYKPFKYDKVDKVEISRAVNRSYTYEVVETIENQEVGEVTFVDENVKSGNQYSYRVKYYLGTNSNTGYRDTGWCDAGLFPGSISTANTDISYVTEKGGYPVVITGTAPEFYKGTETPIEELMSIEVFRTEYNYDTYENEVIVLASTDKDVKAGEEFNVTITEGLKDGLNGLQLRAVGTDGAGEGSYITILFGEDYPGMPQNLSLKENEDGTFALNWEAPKSARGGYFVPENTRYKVTYQKKNDYDEPTLATDLTETTYTATLELDSPTEITFNVYAYNDGGQGQPATATTIAGPAASLPFNESFDVEEGWSSYAPEHLWSSTSSALYGQQFYFSGSANIEGDYVYPMNGEGGMATHYYYYTDGRYQHDWLTSCKINVEGEEELVLSFAVYAVVDRTNIVTAEISFDGAEFIPVTSLDFSTVEESEWVVLNGNVKVPEGAVNAVLRIDSCTGKEGEPISACYLAFDSIKLRSADALAVIYPASATDLKGEYDEENNAIVITLTAPDKTHPSLGDENNAPLEYITRIELFRAAGSFGEYELVHTFDAPKPGEELTWTDTDLGEGGYYRYKAITYVEDKCDFGAFMNNSVLVGQIPARVADLAGHSTKGGAPIVLTWTTPTTDESGNALKAITKMEVKRNGVTSTWSYDVIKTYEEVATGEEYTFEDEDVEEDEDYQYQVICYGSAGASQYAQVSVSTKKDTPAQPKNLKAEVTEDGTIALSWDPVTTGLYNGYIDLDKITYTIKRGFGNTYEYDAEVIATDVTECTFIDADIDFDETSIRYFVKAIAEEKDGPSATSNDVLAGKPYQLPLVENFDVISGWMVTPNNAWVNSTNQEGTTSGGWSYSTYAYVDSESVNPVDKTDEKEDGLAYCYFGIWSSDEYDNFLTSAHIELQPNDTPVATFHYYVVSGFNSKLGFAVSFDNGEFETIWDFDYNEYAGDEAGWEKATVTIDVPEGAKVMQVQFIAHKGSYACPVLIDKVAVFNLPAPELEASKDKLSWTLEETPHADHVGYHIYLEGERHTDEMLSNETSSHTVAADVKGNFTVTALYNDGALESAHSNPVFAAGINGIEGVANTGVTVLTRNGNIVVTGAEGLQVTIHAVDGALVYSAEGDCTVALTPATYLVKVGNAPAVKLFVR